jgi:anti-anti-sigma factor
MKFSVENEDKYSVIVSQVEKLDSLSAPDLKSEILYLTKSGVRNIIVDMGQSRYCDSSGLSALLTGNRLCKELGGTFAISNLQPGVEKLVSISQLDSVFNITPTRNESIDIVLMDEIERELGNSEN